MDSLLVRVILPGMVALVVVVALLIGSFAISDVNEMRRDCRLYQKIEIRGVIYSCVPINQGEKSND